MLTPLQTKIILGAATLLLAGTAAVAFTLLFDFSSPSITLPPPYQLPEPTAPKSTTLLFGGDIMLGREVHIRMATANDFTLPFKNIQSKTQQADLSFANLESPFTNTPLNTTNRLIFRNDDRAIAGLTQAGFDILSTANNHTFDQGVNGIDYTLDKLEAAGITPVGTGPTCHDGTIKEVNGIKFGFLAYSYAAYNDGGVASSPLVCDWKDTAQMVADVQQLKPEVDFLVVSGHFGAEYTVTPSTTDVQRAHAVIDAGADLLVGHHPHWVQNIEHYKGKFIFYSLGNFVFDQMWSQETREGLTAQLLFKDKALDTITLLPVVIDNYCCPRWASDQETKNILQKINPDFESTVLVNNGQTQPDWEQALQNPTLDKSAGLP